MKEPPPSSDRSSAVSHSSIPVSYTHLSRIWRSATIHFSAMFYNKEFGYPWMFVTNCGLRRIWSRPWAKWCSFTKSFPNTMSNDSSYAVNVRVCMADIRWLQISTQANFPYFDAITDRLISPWLSFMWLRRVRYEGHSVIGQINVPFDGKNHMILCTHTTWW